jgi:hypothetical protein
MKMLQLLTIDKTVGKITPRSIRCSVDIHQSWNAGDRAGDRILLTSLIRSDAAVHGPEHQELLRLIGTLVDAR